MRPESRELIEKLVSFNTISQHSNLALITYVQDYLQQHGVESQLIYNEQQNKANLLACIGPEVAGGVVLSGHTDVVPVKGQDWESDPFVLTERAGQIGRASCRERVVVAYVGAVVDGLADGSNV